MSPAPGGQRLSSAGHPADAHVVNVGDLGAGRAGPVVPVVAPVVRVAGAGARAAAVIVVLSVRELPRGVALRLTTCLLYTSPSPRD